MKKTKLLLVTNVVSGITLLFGLYLAFELATSPTDDWGMLFATIFLMFLVTSIVLVAIGLVFGLLAAKKNNRWLTLVSAILYLMGTLVLFNFGVFMLPTLGLSIATFVVQMIQIKKEKQAAAQLLP